MSKCSCYHTKEVRNYTYHPITGAPIPHDQTVGVCYGTKEMDECSCGGDESKCDFYPEKRRGIISTVEVVELKHGEWIYNPNGMDWGLGAWECSLCGCTNNNLPMDDKINPKHWSGTKFCPNCGARMGGDGSGNL